MPKPGKWGCKSARDPIRDGQVEGCYPAFGEPCTIVEIIEDIWGNRDRDYNIRRLVKRLQRIEKEMSGEARGMFAAHIPAGDVGKYASDLPRRLSHAFGDTMTLLQDKVFQDLLMNYPRKERLFIVAHETQDNVSSSWLVRGIDGKEYKPDDYLTAFAQFVRENPHAAAHGLEHEGIERLAAKAGGNTAAVQQRESPKGARIALPKGAGGYHFDGQARCQ